MSGELVDLERLRSAYERVRAELLAERTPDGHWEGELSSSALSTATAVSALAMVRRAQSSGVRVQRPGVKSQQGNREFDSGSEDASTEYSVLSTQYSDEYLGELLNRGTRWLITQQNPDGGFGDTDLSHSNIATTYLVVAALHLASVAIERAELIERANRYIDSKGRLQGLRERYGIDKTFVVPIMMNLALAGIVEWREVDPLPFELACVPQAWYRFVGMPVVSYAIPALVAIGQARFFHAPPQNPLMRLLRRLSIDRSLRVLRQMQPDSGGYLEATPLTSFVVMSLVSTKSRPVAAVHEETETEHTATRPPLRGGALRGFADEVIREGVKFLVNSVRPDGSWPIDTNLATWNTTLAINALAGAGEDVAALLGPQCLDWLLSCQHTKRHPFTGADSGGFGWSDLSGAVPDADDTPGVMLALHSFHQSLRNSEADCKRIEVAVLSGIRWLLKLQNRDGGWPTFCRGWGRLPFDRSGTDLTAHVLRALRRWPLDNDGFQLLAPTVAASTAGSNDQFVWYLKAKQNPDGSWLPLWFGNQDRQNEDNPVYGTAKVLMAYRDWGLMESPEAQRGVAWLVANQNDDGGWGSGTWGKVRNAGAPAATRVGGVRSRDRTERTAEHGVESLGEPVPGTQYSVRSTDPSSHDETSSPKSKIQNLKSSVEETALAVEALLASTDNPDAAAAVIKGLAWLIDRVESGQHRQPAPIGFYFAKLWYYERLYPLIFTVAALGRACRQLALPPESPQNPTETASADARSRTTSWTTQP